MSNFKGNNNSKTLITGVERARYKNLAFGPYEDQVVDFNFAERSFYGRVNRQLNPVIVNEQFLRSFHNQNFQIINFAGDQFKEMYVRYRNALNLSLIDNQDPNLSELKVVRGWESPIKQHSDFMNRFMNDYLVKEMIPNENKIDSFQTFLKFFEAYMTEQDLDVKITLSGFMKSKQSSIFNTGMALQIAPVGFSDDAIKESTLLTVPNFSFFKNMAKQFGFSINIQNPSVLVSDLAHPVTKKFLAKYDLFSTELIFSEQYLNTYSFDFDLLSRYLLDTYNSFVYLRPDLREMYVCNNKLKSNLYKRNNIDNIDYNVILLYINIRNMEEFFPFSDAEIKSIHGTSVRLFAITQDKALQFIENHFRSKYNTKDGSLTYYRRKLKK